MVEKQLNPGLLSQPGSADGGNVLDDAVPIS